MRALLRGGLRRRLATLTLVTVTAAGVVGVGLGTASADPEHSHHDLVPPVHCIPLPPRHDHGHDHFDRWAFFEREHRHFEHGWPFCRPTTTTTVAPVTTTTVAPT